jgi:flagellar protein FliO/FliZ
LALGIEAVTGPGLGISPWRVLVSLLLVLALGGGVLVVLKRLQGTGGLPPRSGEIRIVGRTLLGRRASLLLVEVDGRRVLIGSTATTLTALSEWDDGVDDLPSLEEARRSPADRFDSVLSRVMGTLRRLDGGAP